MKYIIAILLTVIVLYSCSKSPLVPAVSMAAVNASIGINKAYVTTPYTGDYKQINGLNYGASSFFTLPAGSPLITVVNSADTIKSIFSTNLDVSAGDIYSVFITGLTGTDVVVHKDTIPYRSDSSIGVRFVNLSTTNSPVNIIVVQSGTTEFSNIAYKTVTNFKSYSAKVADPANYSFKVTDGGGNTLATSGNISKNAVLFKNVTLALIGSKDSSGTKALKVITINNYK